MVRSVETSGGVYIIVYAAHSLGSHENFRWSISSNADASPRGGEGEGAFAPAITIFNIHI